MPDRIQLHRTRGWRKPAGAVVVARPSRWGNPYHLRPVLGTWHVLGPIGIIHGRWETKTDAAADAVRLYQYVLERGYLDITPADIRTNLAGHDLACWCPPDQACHADVLLELAQLTSEGAAAL